MPGNGTALGNTVELQLNQGKLEEAAATAARLGEVSPGYGAARRLFISYAQGDDRAWRSLTDSLMRAGGTARRRSGLDASRSVALMDGRLRDYASFTRELGAPRGTPLPDDAIFNIWIEMAVKGPSPAAATRCRDRAAADDAAADGRPAVPRIGGALARAGSVERRGP